jgi:hypothetical protein
MRTDWARSPACPGHSPRLAERLGQEVLQELTARRAIRPAPARPARARWELTSEVLCMPDSVQWNLGLVDPATTEVGWIKAFEAPTARKLEGLKGRAVKLLTAFIRDGKLPDDVAGDDPAGDRPAPGPGDEPVPVGAEDGPTRLAGYEGGALRGQRLVCLPLEASSRDLLSPEELRALDRRFTRALASEAGAEITPAPAALRALASLGGRSLDEAVALGLARELGASRALVLELAPRQTGCLLAASLLAAPSGELLAAHGVPCACERLAVERAQDELLELLQR